eukprot:5313225-Alexandrium_andersonii.AAC.1
MSFLNTLFAGWESRSQGEKGVRDNIVAFAKADRVFVSLLGAQGLHSIAVIFETRSTCVCA